MGDFSATWLRLREPVDHAARSEALTRDLLRALPGARLRILDLACGTGSNLRYLGRQILAADWQLVDHDPTLLALVPAAPNVKVVNDDLRRLDNHLFDDRSLVTASALLDLVSESWMRELAARCRARASAVLFALTYDGRMAFEPAEPGDTLIRELVNRHQLTDKGFGPALGPAATNVAADIFRDVDYVVRTASSDWVLRRATAPDELQEQLIDGWAHAAAEVAPERAAEVDAWRRKRLVHVEAGRSLITVGHQDLAGVPSHYSGDTWLRAGPAAIR